MLFQSTQIREVFVTNLTPQFASMANQMVPQLVFVGEMARTQMALEEISSVSSLVSLQHVAVYGLVAALVTAVQLFL